MNISDSTAPENLDTQNLPIVAIIIGDEILSGRRQDQHLYWLSKTLNDRGLSLSQAIYIADNQTQIVDILRRTFMPPSIVFCFGGIGATPDDHTRQASAIAFERPLQQHPEATQLIIQRFGDKAYPNRIRMAQLPENAELIPNPINQIPGFSLNHHHFLPGFPEMAWPMLKWLLDTRYAKLSRKLLTQLSVIVVAGLESELLPLMEKLVADHPTVRLASLPSYGNSSYLHPHIELSVTGESQATHQAFAQLIDGLKQLRQQIIINNLPPSAHK